MNTDMPPAAGLEPSLPSADYTGDAAFAREKERIFCREWVAACREEDLPASGDRRVFDVLGESILVTRDKAGGLHGFYNVCRHRGARLCAAEGERPAPGRAPLKPAVLPSGAIRCPYHAWLYDASGALAGAPHLDGRTLPKAELSLYPVDLATWGGFVFLRLDPGAGPDLTAQLAPVAARIANYPLAAMRTGFAIRYEVAANWKVICENYNECYHCGPVHPELCEIVPAFRAGGGAGLDWEEGIPHRDGADTFTRTGVTARASFPGLSPAELVRHKGELAYPNLFLSMARDHVAAFILRPRAPARTTVDCVFLFAADEMEKPGFDPSDAAGFWDLVNRQDWAICEHVQQGIGARVHRFGYDAPMEDLNLDMRAYMRDRMG